jgi:hypothetical protein
MSHPLSLQKTLIHYLEKRWGTAVTIQSIRELSHPTAEADALKQFGYGRPLLVTYRLGEEERQEVFHRLRRNAFGRERQDDLVAAIWLDHQTFNQLPRHVQAVDMLALNHRDELHSLQTAVDLLLVTTYQPGQPYAHDLIRIRDEGTSQPLDEQRTIALARYLAQIHAVKKDEPALWQRRLRDLIGHGEGIMGLTDSYPPSLAYVSSRELQQIEQEANCWRWRLKPLTHRLCQVHGDFHPFNIIFDRDTEFYVLDRSRGVWGEAADDVSCLTINYIFFSLQRVGQLARPFDYLHDLFWQTYLAARPDGELTAVIQPWLAWRALVLASPIWYPTLGDDIRRKLLAFARHVLTLDTYDYTLVNDYLEAN